jgi:hypothetical protein
VRSSLGRCGVPKKAQCRYAAAGHVDTHRSRGFDSTASGFSCVRGPHVPEPSSTIRLCGGVADIRTCTGHRFWFLPWEKSLDEAGRTWISRFRRKICSSKCAAIETVFDSIKPWHTPSGVSG